MRRSPATRLLVRHFLRRFFENDLISPHIDLHDNIVQLSTGFICLTLFASVFIGSKYLIGIPPPGVVAMSSLFDSFLLISISMFAMALVATVQWDAISLDIRDAANLAVLPIQRRTLVTAKLAALAVFGTGLAITLNLFPSTILQAATIVKMPLGLFDLVRLTSAHAAASLLASAFGFLAIVALRESLRAVFGDAGFARVSALVQGVLVLALTSALLMTPGFASAATGSWLRNGFPSSWMPPLWFFGLKQVLAGDIIADVAGMYVPRRMVDANNRALASYQVYDPFFSEWAKFAVIATVTVVFVAAATYAWNLRRPLQPIASSKRRRIAVSRISAIAVPGDSIRRAGFTFALLAMVRSAPHRLAMAGAGALAIALSIGLLSRTGFRPALNPWTPPVSILMIQIACITILLAGFRRAVRVPAELRANWMMQIAWRDGERRFVSGVKRAAVIGVALPVLLVLAPLHVWLLSPQVAGLHVALGVCYSVAFAEALFSRCRKVPLASSYEPLSSVKTVGPIAFLLFLVFVNAFARIERQALQSVDGMIKLALTLLAAAAVFRTLDYWTLRSAPQMKFDEPPDPATQWLGLSG
jgi:hypothetical protein